MFWRKGGRSEEPDIKFQNDLTSISIVLRIFREYFLHCNGLTIFFLRTTFLFFISNIMSSFYFIFLHQNIFPFYILKKYFFQNSI